MKTKLDPEPRAILAEIAIPYPGKMFDKRMHNRGLGCLMVAVFDVGTIRSASIPISSRYDNDVPKPDTKFAATPVRERLRKVFPNLGEPIIYMEAVRMFSEDGTAQCYQPVYAYVGKMAKQAHS